jgi:hypothetical protein
VRYKFSIPFKTRKKHSWVKFNFYIFGQPMWKQKTMDQMVAGIPSAQCVNKFIHECDINLSGVFSNV